MPTIKSSTDLRNHYNEISTLCHETHEPVFITKNGRGDLVIMSMELYDEFMSEFDLYSSIREGINDVRDGKTMPLDEAMEKIRNSRAIPSEQGLDLE